MIDVTSRAIAQIRKMMKDQGLQDAALRLGVKTSGCSGLEYVMDFVTQADPADDVTDVDGLKVCVDPESSPYLKEIVLDWGDSLLGGFKFTNPNADKTCGCGKSFSV